jgi:integrase
LEPRTGSTAGMLRLYASPAIGARLLTDLNPITVQRLYAQLLARGLSGGTVLNLHLVLTQCFGQAVKWGLLTADPAAGAQPPRPRRPELAIVDPSLVGRILEAVQGTPMELPAAMAIATGMRRGEILARRRCSSEPHPVPPSSSGEAKRNPTPRTVLM